MNDLEHIELAKRIMAAKRGEGPPVPLDELRAGVDSIRVARRDFVAAQPKRAKRDPQTAEPLPSKAQIQVISFDDF